jgi:hypothetical protein
VSNSTYQAPSHTLVFPDWYDELAEFEHEHKGHLSGATLRLADGRVFGIEFIDPARLQQDLQDNCDRGEPFVLMRNLVLVPLVSRVSMQRAIDAIACSTSTLTQLQHE